jgi:hypothetical protein
MEKIINNSAVVKVDDQDGHLLTGRAWKLVKHGRKSYVIWSTTESGKRRKFFLHRLLMNAKAGQIIDHIDGDPLNNCRANLRIVDATQNARNAVKGNRAGSRFKGVTNHPDGWHARIWSGEKNLHLGKTQNEVQAAYWYDIASLERHGEHGRRNFLPLVTG